VVLNIYEGAWDILGVMMGVAISYMMWQSLCFNLIGIIYLENSKS